MPSYRAGRMTPAAERAEASDQSKLRVIDHAATSTLVGHGLGVARVECLASQLDEAGTPRTVVWHREPSVEQRERAAELLAARSLSHVV